MLSADTTGNFCPVWATTCGPWMRFGWNGAGRSQSRHPRNTGRERGKGGRGENYCSMVIEFQCGEDKMINFMLCIFATIKKKYLSKNNGTNRTSKLIFQTNSNGLLYLIRMSSLGPKVWSSPKSVFLALLSDAPRLCLQSQQQFPF